MGQLLSDSLLIFGFLAIVLAPLTLVLDTGPGGAGWKLLTFLCCTLTAWFFFFRLKSAHRACSMGSSVGMRDGHANKLLSTRRVIRAPDRGEYRQAARTAPIRRHRGNLTPLPSRQMGRIKN